MVRLRMSRVIRGFGLVAAAALLLAACGKGPASQGPAPSSQATQSGEAGKAGEGNGSGQAQQTIVLKYAFFAPAQTFPAMQMKKWSEEVEKRTGGKVKIQQFPGGTLLKANDMYDGVLAGVADIGLGAPSYDPGRFPLLEGVVMPVGFPNSTVANLAYWDLLREFDPPELKDFKVLTVFTSEPGFLQTIEPVRTANDLKGKRIRGQGPNVAFLQALGASAVGASMSEVPELISTGAIRGYVSSREVLKDLKLAEKVKYVTDYPISGATFAAVMTKKRWSELPPDVQKVMDDLSREMALWTGQYHDKENVGGAMEWAKKEHGLQVITLSPEEKAKWDSLAKPIIDKWVSETEAKGLPARQFMKRLLELRDKYSKEYGSGG